VARRPTQSEDTERTLSLARRRSLVARHTRLRPLEDVPTIRLYLADDVGPVWRATEEALGVPTGPIPFWAFAWAGGIAIAKYLLEHPEEVTGRAVLDLATGSGLCGIAAMQAGAASVTAVDVDPFAEAAAAANARANGVRLRIIRGDLFDDEPPDVDVLLAGDTWYESPLADRVLPWLQRAAEKGTRVLVGDPGRRYLPATGLVPLAAYEVHTTTQLEDRDIVTARVFTVAAG
jgi:predicted nicotinamide N-methyase